MHAQENSAAEPNLHLMALRDAMRQRQPGSSEITAETLHMPRLTIHALLCLLAAFPIAARGQPKMTVSENLCVNGDFENLEEAMAGPLPKRWSEVRNGPTARVEACDDAFRGRHSLRLSAAKDDVAGMNSAKMAAIHGTVRFRYKAIRSSSEGGNLWLYVIGLSRLNGLEVQREGFHPPKEHMGDGQWHEGSFEFNFERPRIAYSLVAPRINEGLGNPGDGEWLIDAVEVYPVRTGPRIKLAHLWCGKPLARTGEAITFSAWVENSGDQPARTVSVEIKASEGSQIAGLARRTCAIEPGSYERLDWILRTVKPTTAEVEVSAALGSEAAAGSPMSNKILVMPSGAKRTRQELCTDEVGYWRLLDRPVTLQEGNKRPLAKVQHKTSSEIERSPYGLCIQLPRSKDYEDPFNPTHLIDDDSETCWSSQQNPSPYPGQPPYAEIDLGREVAVKQVNLIPYWRNTDFPLGFSVRVSSDAKNWRTVVRVKDHELVDGGETRGDKLAQVFPLEKAAKARYLRIDFERLPLSGGNFAEVSQGYKARLSGIEVIDEAGRNLALLRLGARVTASDIFTGWQNTASSVRKAFRRVFDLGVKWVRVGQWGDQTEWAAVEREKGEFRMDPATDAAIRKLTDHGVGILYGLNYGNAIYERPEHPGEIGPIFKEGHPFSENCGPRTEEGRRAFVRYVDFVVRKYKDRVRWWELWNEENGWFPGHEPELYGKLLYAVAQHIKEIDPSLKVMFGGTAAPAPITTGIALREGGAPFVDAYAFHPYGIDKPEGGMGTMEYYQGKNVSQSREETGWNRLEEIVAGVKKPFAQNGRPEVEVWLNEWSTNVSGQDFTYKPGIGEYGCAKYLMRFYLYSGWLGLPTAWWALYTENMSQDWGVVTPHDCGFRPLSYALQNLCSVLSDVEPLPAPEYKYEGAAPDLKVIAYARDGSDEKLVLIWAAEMANEEVKAYPSKLSFAVISPPTKATLTDLYWGVSQVANWSYENGRVTLDGLIVRDYPVVISWR